MMTESIDNSDWLGNSVMYELNTWAWLNQWSQRAKAPLTLATLPKEAWDELLSSGASAIWLMGVWERSRLSINLFLQNHEALEELRSTMGTLTRDDILGSPYSIRRYEVDSRLGGNAGLCEARKQLFERGMRLVLDFVPNHVAPEHCWVSEHPDWFICGSFNELLANPAAFLEIDGKILARGRDPYFEPWSDVLQLNAFNLEYRQTAIRQLCKIASQCDGVRCDMAMLVLNQVFQKTWEGRVGRPPDQGFWYQVIREVKGANPGFKFLAEAYWGREEELLNEGFDACYDKSLYDCLLWNESLAIRDHLRSSLRLQDRLVRFIENHDEKRAAEQFGSQKGLAAMIAIMTLPGIRLIHEGQSTGRRKKTPLHVNRHPQESPDQIIEAGYRTVFKLAGSTILRKGHWYFCETTRSADRSDSPQMLAWCWRLDNRLLLAVFNFSSSPAEGMVTLPNDIASLGWQVISNRNLSTFASTCEAVPFETVRVLALKPWGVRLIEMVFTS